MNSTFIYVNDRFNANKLFEVFNKFVEYFFIYNITFSVKIKKYHGKYLMGKTFLKISVKI